MLKVGELLPNFHAIATDGRSVCADSLRGKLVVIFFFPKAFTPGCTRETKGFRDEYPAIAQCDAQIVGVSTDTVDAQCRFAEWAGVPFPLIGDTDRNIASKFGVLWPVVGVAKRVTFVADATGIVRHVFHHELRVDRHVVDVKRAVEELARAS